MDKQEKIVCAAVRHWMGKSEDIELCLDYPDHLTDLFYQIGDIGYQKGFITNEGRFVDPKEAEVIAGLAGQIWVDSGRHNLSSIQFEKSLKKMWGDGKVTMSIKFPSSTGHYFIHHTIGMGLKPEDLY